MEACCDRDALLKGKLAREIEGLLKVLLKKSGDEAHTEDIVLQTCIQSQGKIAVIIQMCDLENLVEVVAAVDALLGKKLFQEQLMVGEAFTEEEAKPLDARRIACRRAIM